MYSFDLDIYHATNDTAQATQELLFADPMDVKDRVVTEVAWVGTNDLIVKETDRAASRERAAHFDFAENTASRTREGVVTRDTDWVKLDGGWAETGQYVHGIDAFSASSSAEGALPEGYLDIVPDSRGYSHIALFSPANEKEPLFLTSGEWEIDGGVQAVDVQRKLMCVHFAHTSPRMTNDPCLQILHRQQSIHSEAPLQHPATVSSRRHRAQGQEAASCAHASDQHLRDWLLQHVLLAASRLLPAQSARWPAMAEAREGGRQGGDFRVPHHGQPDAQRDAGDVPRPKDDVPRGASQQRL